MPDADPRHLRRELICSFRSEILVTVMRHHQRYFSVVDSDGKLAPEFIAVMNTDPIPQGLVQHRQ